MPTALGRLTNVEQEGASVSLVYLFLGTLAGIFRVLKVLLLVISQGCGRGLQRKGHFGK